MKVKKVLVFILIPVLMLCFSACVQSMDLIVRFDFNSSDIDTLYKNMPEKEVFELLGLPHRSTIYIDTSSYDYFNEYGILRVEFANHKLKDATFYGLNDANPVRLQEKKTIKIDSDKYLREINYNISSDELEFINSDTNSEKIQTTLGPPHDTAEYDLDGFILNAFIYNLSDGNKLYIVYKRNGVVGLAQIYNKDEEIVKEIVKMED